MHSGFLYDLREAHEPHLPPKLPIILCHAFPPSTASLKYSEVYDPGPPSRVPRGGSRTDSLGQKGRDLGFARQAAETFEGT